MSDKSVTIKPPPLYTIQSFIIMLVGVVCATLALKGFMIPNGFLDGGITGISLLIHEIWHVNFSMLLIVLNTLFFFPAYKYLGKFFAIRFFISVVALSIAVHFINIDPFTSDKLLIAIFGGCLIGLGMGLVIRSGSALDGFEILAVFTTRKIGFSMSEVILFFNSIIFITAAYKFGVSTAMYSIITYFAALKTVDYIVDGIEEYISMTIISKESEQIKSLLVNYFGKGITVYKGERGFLPGNFEAHTNCDIIVTIVTRLELLSINNEILKIDEKAFMHTHSVKETKGGIVKHKAGH